MTDREQDQASGYAAGLRTGAIVVAFDGVIAETRAARASALSRALVRHGVGMRAGSIPESTVDGVSLFEAARSLVANPNGAPSEDETLADLIALDASREFSRSMSQGVSVVQGVHAWIARQSARSVRIVARADSTRRELQSMAGIEELETSLTFIRCSDDVPRVVGMTTAAASWQAIDHRLTTMRVARARRHAVEFAPRVLPIASAFAARITSDLKFE